MTAQPEKNLENQLVMDAAQALEQIAGIPVAIRKVGANTPDMDTDAEIRVADRTWQVEINRNLTPANLGQAAARVQRFKKPALLVTRYVTPTMAERLKALNVPFMDMAGNVYLPGDKQFIFITGQKLPGPPEAERPTRAFNATGLKLVFALLCQPGLVAAPYRQIANVAGVALGTVGWVMRDLKKFRYVTETRTGGRTIQNTAALIDVWVAGYPRELRPKLHVRRFDAPHPNWWQDVDWRHFGAWLGGEPAAAELTAYLKPQIITVYCDAGFNELVRGQRLRRNTTGDVEIMDAFWHFDYDWPHPHLAPPLLIYAELIATADARNLETARMIYDQYLT